MIYDLDSVKSLDCQAGARGAFLGDKVPMDGQCLVFSWG